MKKIIVFGLDCLMMSVSGCEFSSLWQKKNNLVKKPQNIQIMIEQAFKEKYPEWDMQEVVIKIGQVDQMFASGSVGDKSGLGGAAWLGYRENGRWSIVYDGNGDVPCEVVDLYEFPAEMVTQCYDEENKLMVDRLADNNEVIVDDGELLQTAMEDYLTDGKLVEFWVNSVEGNYAEGSMTLEEEVGGWWLGFKNDGQWEIVATGSDLVACELIEKYGFPSDMVVVCYDEITNDRRILVTLNDLDKFVSKVGDDLGLNIGAVEDIVFEWQEYDNLVRIKGRGATANLNQLGFQSMEEKITEVGYYPDENNYSKQKMGFYVKDIIVCELDKYSDKEVYVSCGAV
jgi:hypothetical protein